MRPNAGGRRPARLFIHHFIQIAQVSIFTIWFAILLGSGDGERRSGAGGHGSWGASDERREAQISMPEAIAWDARAFDSGVIAIPATPRTGMGSRIPFASIMI